MNFSELTKYIVKRWNSLKRKVKYKNILIYLIKIKKDINKKCQNIKINKIVGEQIKQEIEIENKIKKSKKQTKNNECQIIDCDARMMKMINN